MGNFNYGENLRRIRTSKGISQEAVALHLNISQKTYSRMEHQAAVPDINIVHATAAFLGVEPSELLPPIAEIDPKAKPALPEVPWQHKAKEILTIPFFGPGLIVVIFVTLVPAAFGLAQGICLYLETSDETETIARRSASVVMFIFLWYWVKKIKKSQYTL